MVIVVPGSFFIFVIGCSPGGNLIRFHTNEVFFFKKRVVTHLRHCGGRCRYSQSSEFFVFNDYSFFDFDGISPFFMDGCKFTTWAEDVHITSARNSRRAAITAAVKVILDHFVYLAKAGCWSSNS